MKKFNQKKGFTLIELLVVISIVGVLSSVVLQSVKSARLKAEDIQRTSDIKAIETALNMYFNDNGTYPASATTCATGDWPTNFKNALVPKYISSLPLDPKNELRACANPSWNYYYGFSNPYAGGWGGCSSGLILLFSIGRPSGRVYQDACGMGANSRISTIILTK